MKKLIFALTVLSLICVSAFAQSTQAHSMTDADASEIGNTSAKQALIETSVDRFEREGFWNVHISSDDGIISSRLFGDSTNPKGPEAKEPLQDDGAVDTVDDAVFGAKVEFFRRGIDSFYITAQRPIPIAGITKTVSLWVCGRNMQHEMWLLVQDYNGNNFELWMGTLQFSGWKRMTVAIPPSFDGVHGIVQNSAYYGDKPGLRILGFRVDCNPMEAKGAYYIYLDDLRAVSDVYDIQNRDADDMYDNW